MSFVGGPPRDENVDVRFGRIWQAREEAYRAGDRSPAALVELAEMNLCHPLGSVRANLLYREALRAKPEPALRVRAAESLIGLLTEGGRYADAVALAREVGQPLFVSFVPAKFSPALSALEHCEVSLGHSGAALARLRRATTLDESTRAAAIGELLSLEGKLAEAEVQFRAARNRASIGLARDLTDALAANLRAQGRADEADAIDDSEYWFPSNYGQVGSRPIRRDGDAWACFAREQWFETHGCLRQAEFYARERARLLAAHPAREDERAQALERASQLSRSPRFAIHGWHPRRDRVETEARWQIVRRRWVDRAANREIPGDRRFPGRGGLALAARDLASLHIEHGESARAVAVLEEAQQLLATDQHGPDGNVFEALGVERALGGDLEGAEALAVRAAAHPGNSSATFTPAMVLHARGRFLEALQAQRGTLGGDWEKAPHPEFPRFRHDDVFRRFVAPAEVPNDLGDLDGI